jgi:hypothetical protein
VTKSDQETVSTPKNNINADDQKSHFMSQLMNERAKQEEIIAKTPATSKNLVFLN